jgi:hypothetical protein
VESIKNADRKMMNLIIINDLIVINYKANVRDKKAGYNFA